MMFLELLLINLKLSLNLEGISDNSDSLMDHHTSQESIVNKSVEKTMLI